MTIKRRLLLYSIAINLTLGLLCLVMIFSAKIFMFGLRDTDRRLAVNSPGFFRVKIEKVTEHARRWAAENNPTAMLAEIDTLNGRYAGSGEGLLVYKDGRPLTSLRIELPPEMLDGILAKTGVHVTVEDRTAVYSRTLGDYRILMVDTNFWLGGPFREEKVMGWYVLTGLFVFAVAGLLSSLFMVKFVSRHILGGLATLSDGVHEIRDGNLDYRIAYAPADEISTVCGDFNEMAGRLAETVRVKRRDEERRKELIAGISHDLRTPLTAIKAYAEGLASGVAATPEMRGKYLGIIKTKAEDMEKILRQLFLFSKLEVRTFPLELEDVDLDRELAAMVDQARDGFGRAGLDIAFTGAETPARVRVDLALLRNALGNILENSLKYRGRERGRLEARLAVDDGRAVITLADDGPGVPDEALEKLFEIFYRCDEARSHTGRGSGLGLAITARIIRQLGGAIRAENVPGGGLATIITIPLAEGAHGQGGCPGPSSG